MKFRVFAFYVANVAAFFLLAGFASAQLNSPNQTLLSLQPDSTNESTGASSLFAAGSISGIVLSSDNHSVDQARIEIRNIATGQGIASGYTDRGGAFRVEGVPRGNYEIVATFGVSEARQQVTLDGQPTELSLRLANTTLSQVGPAVVSVHQLSVPQKAKDALSKAQEAAGKNETAVAQGHIAEALAVAPRYSDAIAFRAVLAMSQRDFTAANSDFQEAIQLDGSNPMPYVGLGALYNMEGKYDDASREIQRGIALNPDLWNAHFEMSRAELGRGNFDQALKEVNRAEALSGKHFSPLHLIKGKILLGLKLYPSAIKEFESFITQNKDDPTTNAQVEQTIDQAKMLAAAQR